MSDYRPGQRYTGADGDVLFVITTETGIEFVTNRGTRVSLGEAARVYAPLTLMPEAEDVAELAAAIREALDLPDHAPGSTEAFTAHRELLATRADYVRGALAPLAEGESPSRHAIASLRRADEWYPVTYSTADSTADEQDVEDRRAAMLLASCKPWIGRRVHVSLKGRDDGVAEVRGVLTDATRAGLWIGGEDGEHVLLANVAAVERWDLTCVECGGVAVEVGPSTWAHEVTPEDGHGVLEVRA